MKSNFIRLQGATHKDRHEMIDRIKDAISRRGGFIVDFKMFSNVSICVNFEVSSGSLGTLCLALADEEFLDMSSMDQLKECVSRNETAAIGEDISGTINLTFVHKEPDLKIQAPAIPG